MCTGLPQWFPILEILQTALGLSKISVFGVNGAALLAAKASLLVAVTTSFDTARYRTPCQLCFVSRLMKWGVFDCKDTVCSFSQLGVVFDPSAFFERPIDSSSNGKDMESETVQYILWYCCGNGAVQGWKWAGKEYGRGSSNANYIFVCNMVAG